LTSAGVKCDKAELFTRVGPVFILKLNKPQGIVAALLL
jgi:hypothetical protein